MTAARELTPETPVSRRQRPPRPGVATPWPDATRQARAAGLLLPPRRLPLAAACGRVLAADLVAVTDLPVSDTAAMDGWAVTGPPPWRVVADLPAGHQLDTRLAVGECVFISTGAVVPAAADAVLPVERSVSDASGVRPADPGATLPSRSHIRPAGEEARRGDLLLSAGTLVTPPVVGLAAAAGHDTLQVTPSAAVDVLVLGDELTCRGRSAPGRTRDALGPQLPAWLVAFGAAPAAIVRLPDRLSELVAAVAVSGADVVITTGGTSVGPGDHVRAAVAQAGGRIIVGSVRVRPGHPMLLAELPRGRWLVGLPGNPLAACVALLTLVQPLLEGMHGRGAPQSVTATLATAEPGTTDGGHRLLPVQRGENGDAVVLPSSGTAMLRGLAQATGLIAVPPGGAAAGDHVGYLPLPWQRLMNRPDNSGRC